jgi:hypothetical protein
MSESQVVPPERPFFMHPDMINCGTPVTVIGFSAMYAVVRRPEMREKIMGDEEGASPEEGATLLMNGTGPGNGVEALVEDAGSLLILIHRRPWIRRWKFHCSHCKPALLGMVRSG